MCRDRRPLASPLRICASISEILSTLQPQSAERLRITEIFYSLQGESLSSGVPTVFVRLTGCPLRCHYCDTAYAFHGGTWRSLGEVLSEVAAHAPCYVTVTGGEPLAQPACLPLLRALCDTGYQVSLETGGALSVTAVDARVARVMDIKTPGSGEQDKNLWDNMAALTRRDQIKFVICDERDYRWSVEQLRRHRLERRVGALLFSPSHGQLPPRQLADWILRDHLPVRMQLQLHKLIWGDEPGR